VDIANNLKVSDHCVKTPKHLIGL